MARIRLSPSGPFINGVPVFDDGAILRNVYWSACPKTDEILDVGATTPTNLATFDVVLPNALPSGEVFDPSFLCYAILTNIVAGTDNMGGTDGPSIVDISTAIDRAGATPPWFDLLADIPFPTVTFQRDSFAARSKLHLFGEGTIDIVDATKIQLFYPFTIDIWNTSVPIVPPLAPWVAGTTRQIRSQVQGLADVGTLVLPARLSRVMILEFYGNLSGFIHGTPGP